MSEAQSGGRRLLGQVLKSRKVVGEGQVQEALEAQREQGGLLGQVLVMLALRFERLLNLPLTHDLA